MPESTGGLAWENLTDHIETTLLAGGSVILPTEPQGFPRQVYSPGPVLNQRKRVSELHTQLSLEVTMADNRDSICWYGINPCGCIPEINLLPY